jgi:glycosyltransferase involved in cell wall biosynthesis
MLKISAVIITHNEERNIERCILSLRDVADEIVIFDSYSTDKTKEICSKYPVKFYQKEWMGYSSTKNFANQTASYNYILSLDADEVLSSKLKEEIIKIKKSDTVLDSYTFNRLTNYCGNWIHHSGWYPDKKLRLWNKQKGRWEGEIHEKVTMDKDSTQGHLNGDLLHYSYYSVDEHRKRVKKYAEKSAQISFNNKKSFLTLKIYLGPIVRFLRNYFVKLGFLDGYSGFLISVNEAYGVYIKYLTINNLKKSK